MGFKNAPQCVSPHLRNKGNLLAMRQKGVEKFRLTCRLGVCVRCAVRGGCSPDKTRPETASAGCAVSEAGGGVRRTSPRALRRRRRRARPAFAISTRRRQKMRERCLLRSLLSLSLNTRKKCHSALTVMSNVGRCYAISAYICAGFAFNIAIAAFRPQTPFCMCRF